MEVILRWKERKISKDNVSSQTLYNEYKQNGKGYKGYSWKYFVERGKSHTVAKKETRKIKQRRSVWAETAQDRNLTKDDVGQFTQHQKGITLKVQVALRLYKEAMTRF